MQYLADPPPQHHPPSPMGVTENEGSLEISQEKKSPVPDLRPLGYRISWGELTQKGTANILFGKIVLKTTCKWRKFGRGQASKFIYLDPPLLTLLEGAHKIQCFIYLLGSVADLGGAPQARVPKAQNFVNFMHLLENLVKIVWWRPYGGSASPPARNPGSAPGSSNYWLRGLFIKQKVTKKVTSHFVEFVVKQNRVCLVLFDLTLVKQWINTNFQKN